LEKKHIIVKSIHSSIHKDFKNPIDKNKNNRLKRLRLKLLPYTFKLEYFPVAKLIIADLLSRNRIQLPKAQY